MTRIGFKMQLFPGKVEEYKRRHDEIWPELAALLRDSTISDYSIFLDETTHSLFATLKVERRELMDQLPEHPVMKKWWAYMKDLMESNADGSPVSVPLEEVFYLP
jgi:L-rhamnose mutarotase